MLASLATHAHHSSAGFDTKQTVTVQGVVKRIDWFNPHVYVYVEQTTDTGQKVEWEIECFPPMALRGFGWLKDTVRVGDTLTAKGNPARNPASKELFPSEIKRGNASLFTLQGAVQALYSPANAAKPTTQASSLDGTWETVVNMRVLTQVGRPDPAKLTKEGVEALRRFDEKTSPANNCIPLPPPLWMIIPDIKRIALGQEEILIEGEIDVGHRTIHMNVTTHAGAIPSFQGHSIGRWEGKTLVVDSTHFAYHGMGNGGGNGIAPNLPSSTQKHLVERFTPSDDGKSLSYEFELTDPVFLTAPWKASVQWVYRPNAKLDTTPCNLDSAQRFIKN